MINKKANKLPSRSTVLNINIKRLLLSQAQLAEELTSKQITTLYTDETTKDWTKYNGYHISDSEGRMYVLGSREIQTKSAKDTLQEILDDIQNSE